MPACADSYQPSLLEKKCSVSFSAPICVLNHLLLVSSADNLFTQLGPRSDPAKLSCENGAHVKSRMSLCCWRGKGFFFIFKRTFLFFNFLSYFIALSFLTRIRLGNKCSLILAFSAGEESVVVFSATISFCPFFLLVPFFPQSSIQFC